MAVDFNQVLDNVVSTTLPMYIDTTVDNTFLSIPLTVRLLERDNIKKEGGTEIIQPYIHSEMDSHWYKGSGPLNISRKETQTGMRFDWAQAQCPILIPMGHLLMNSGEFAVSSILTSVMQQGEVSLRQNIGRSIFSDGTGDGGAEIVGLRQAVHDVGLYGKIDRSTVEGSKLLSFIDAAGGAITLLRIQKAYGKASLAPEYPDLIVTTQAQFDAVWALVNASERLNRADGALGEVGFPAIRINQALMVVDQMCPAGEMYLLNTKWIKMIFHAQRMFTLEGPFPLPEQDARLWRLHVMMAMIVQSPRLCSKIVNLTE